MVVCNVLFSSNPSYFMRDTCNPTPTLLFSIKKFHDQYNIKTTVITRHEIAIIMLNLLQVEFAERMHMTTIKVKST